jgi:hypothetical protein
VLMSWGSLARIKCRTKPDQSLATSVSKQARPDEKHTTSASVTVASRGRLDLHDKALG